MNINIKKRRLIKKKSQVLDLDITSLMDIMTILLVFLLKSYNPSDLFVELTKDIDLPPSRITDVGNHSVILRVDKNKKIKVDDTEVLEVSKLEAILVSKKNNLLQEWKKNNREKKEVPLNFVFHKGLEFKDIKPFINTATVAGFNQFKFIVKGNE